MEFWARRRAAVEAEARAEEAARAREAAALREAAQAEKTDDELLEELGLPEPETLGADGDFKAFLAEGVPQRLKTRALRCLWRSNPVLACLDGLNDYDDDFTGDGLNGGPLRTAYQVGKGLRAHVEEVARQAEAAAAAAERAPEPDTGTEMDAETDAVALAGEMPGDVPGDMPNTGAEQRAAPDADAATQTDIDEAPLPPRRRMAFTFDETTA